MNEIFLEKSEKTPTTDNEWAKLFEKIAEEVKPVNSKLLTDSIYNMFHNNEYVTEKYNKWLCKIAYDKNKLKEIFQK